MEMNDIESYRLRKYLLQDWWSPRKAAMILGGYDPDRSGLIDEERFSQLSLLTSELILKPGNDVSDPKVKLFKAGHGDISRISDIWEGSDHSRASTREKNGLTEYTRDYCIEWAQRKKIEVIWLSWARENGYLDTLPRTTKEREVNGKSRNSFLRTINALATALINGRTGRPSTDAEAVIAILDRNPGHGVSHESLRRLLTEYDKHVGD